MFLVISLTIAVFLVLFVIVAIGPKAANCLLLLTGGIAFLGGLFFYGWIFSGADTVLGVAQTCYITCLQFLGESPYEIIKDFLPDAAGWQEIVMTGLCFCGVFTTAGTAISAIGSKFLRIVRVWFQRSTPLAIIHPLTPDTLEFARELTQEKNTMVVFVDETPEPSCVEAAERLDCIIRQDDDARQGTIRFLWSIGARKGNREISLYALSNDQFLNRKYARNLVASMEKRELSKDQTRLTVFANGESIDNKVLCTESGYSFGTMMCISQEQMAARLLLQKSPVWETMTFDKDGRAQKNFHALVIGSGKIGQAVIKQIVMNGQFSGSKCTVSVFDPKYESVVGKLRYECGDIFKEYTIDTHPVDARSCEMYEFLQKKLQDLHYIVVCTGNDASNLEISQQLINYMQAKGCLLPVHICSRRGLQQITDTDVKHWGIFTSQVLCTDDIDRKAMLLNNIYCGGTEETVRKNWGNCDYFSRMSSRASADYAPAFLKMLGRPADEIPAGTWYTPEQMENMAISEHMRWCAFHYCMGIRKMSDEEFNQRCQTYLEEKTQNPQTRYRITKNLDGNGTHACLIPWDDLDTLSAAENAVTGGNKDYKQMDRDNVTMLPRLMASK